MQQIELTRAYVSETAGGLRESCSDRVTTANPSSDPLRWNRVTKKFPKCRFWLICISGPATTQELNPTKSHPAQTTGPIEVNLTTGARLWA